MKSLLVTELQIRHEFFSVKTFSSTWHDKIFTLTINAITSSKMKANTWLAVGHLLYY